MNLWQPINTDLLLRFSDENVGNISNLNFISVDRDTEWAGREKPLFHIRKKYSLLRWRWRTRTVDSRGWVWDWPIWNRFFILSVFVVYCAAFIKHITGAFAEYHEKKRKRGKSVFNTNFTPKGVNSSELEIQNVASKKSSILINFGKREIRGDALERSGVKAKCMYLCGEPVYRIPLRHQQYNTILNKCNFDSNSQCFHSFRNF